tara:strand:- start:313 stop:636 length:324 start_codon:yes stop_codon:yes gene_type:complete
MGLIRLGNITQQDIYIKKEHPFEVCFELDEEVAGKLEMSSAYTCNVKHWETNLTVLKSFDVTVEGNAITVSSDTVTGLSLGEYFFSLQPVLPTLTTYLTIKGGFTVE